MICLINNPAEAEKICREAQSKAEAGNKPSSGAIIDILDKAAGLWKPGSAYIHRAEELLKRGTFSQTMNSLSLGMLKELLAAEYNRKRLEYEFAGNFDKAAERGGYNFRYAPLGVLFHVAAGNIFLGCIDSVIMGLLTGNVNILKLASGPDSAVVELFWESITQADTAGELDGLLQLVRFKGGSKEIESVFKHFCQGLVLWGGEEMVHAYRKDLPANVKLIEYGPKMSAGLVFSGADLERAAAGIARDVSIWDQSACASPQTIYGIGLTENEQKQLTESLIKSFDELADKYPRGALEKDEQAEITKAIESRRLEILDKSVQVYRAEQWTVVVSRDRAFEPSPLNRFLFVKHVETIDQVIDGLKPYAGYLQTLGVALDDRPKPGLYGQLYRLGITKITDLGKMLSGETGAPHDGVFPCVQLTRIVSLEGDLHARLLRETLEWAQQNVPFYRRRIKTLKLADVPLLTKDDLFKHGPPAAKAMLAGPLNDAIVFGSGGSTGKPKFVVYSHREFSDINARLGRYMQKAGLSKSDRVANIFFAGNLWSSFLAVEEAVRDTGCFSVPIGGMIDLDTMLSCIHDFKVNVIIGMPSVIVSLAERVIAKKTRVKIDKIFYGGEHLECLPLLKRAFGVKTVKSASYALVESGVVGYQCPALKGSRHHVAMDYQHVEIVDPQTGRILPAGQSGEIVVTNLRRRLMPVVRFRTGDLGKLEEAGRVCACGSDEPVLELMGRCDDLLTVGSIRLNYNIVLEAVSTIKGLLPAVQMIAGKDKKGRDVLTVVCEGKSSRKNAAAVSAKIKGISADIDECLDRGFFSLKVKIVGPGGIKRIARTGKIKHVIDNRKTTSQCELNGKHKSQTINLN